MLKYIKILYSQTAIAYSCLMASVIGFSAIAAAEVSCFGNNDMISGQNQASPDPLLNCYFSQSVSSYSSNSISSTSINSNMKNSIDNGVEDIGSEAFSHYGESYTLSDVANGSSYSGISSMEASSKISFTEKSPGRLAGLKQGFNKVRALTSPLDKKIKGSRLYMKLRGEEAGVVWQINY